MDEAVVIIKPNHLYFLRYMTHYYDGEWAKSGVCQCAMMVVSCE